jgi:HSP20 family molecular chaperone IbpA
MQGLKSEAGDVRRARNEIDRLLSQVVLQGPWAALYGQSLYRPPTDVYETDEAVWVRVEIAGMREEDFRVALIEGTLVVAGVRRDTSPKRGYHQMEIGWGPFQTEVQLNLPVREDDIEAQYDNGFLTIQLPKARRRRIPVQNRDEE